MLLQFTVRNFGSFAEPAELTLASRRLRTNVPRQDESWVDLAEQVATIYGPNASGKTTLLEAIQGVAHAVRVPGSGALYRPSRHSSESSTEPSCFQIDFVADDGVRYSYAVDAYEWGIGREVLTAFPRGTERLVFSRSQDDADAQMQFRKGSSLRGPSSEVLKLTRSNALYLAVASRYGHDGLQAPSRALAEGVGIQEISHRNAYDSDTLRRMMAEIVLEPQTRGALANALAQAADLGIAGVEVEEMEIPDRVRERVVRMLALEDEDSENELPEDLEFMLRNALVFVHRGVDGHEFRLPMRAQSAGTLIWLTTIWNILDALREGSVLLIDELDASLHPQLAAYAVGLFLSRETNPHGAQLIVTTHDVSLLGNSPTRLLYPENVWFTEKDGEGRSVLYSMDEFDNRAKNNDLRRYMAGRFGALPQIDESLVIQLGIETVENVPAGA